MEILAVEDGRPGGADGQGLLEEVVLLCGVHEGCWINSRAEMEALGGISKG